MIPKSLLLFLSIFFLCLGFPFPVSAAMPAASPLAQDYVLVHKTSDEGKTDQWVCLGSPDILSLPSGKLLASMEYWLQMPDHGVEGGIHYPNHCLIKESLDHGQTWTQISTNGVTWGSFFLVNQDLYMIGNDPLQRSIIIVRSNDEGHTWSPTVTLFSDSRYSGAATPVVAWNGHVYRAFEDNQNKMASLVIAGDLSRDLLDPGAWRMSPKVIPPQEVGILTKGGKGTLNWLEGNVILHPDGLLVLHRARIDDMRTVGMTGICELEDDGITMQYRFRQLHPMPGGQNKFKILLDEPSGLYWTTVIVVPDPFQPLEPLRSIGFKGNSAGNMRRMVMLQYSRDGLNWFQAGCVAMSRNPLEAFGYSSQIADGEDLLVLSRSNIGGKLPYNNHDTNAITLHRVKNFRSLALDLKEQ